MLSGISANVMSDNKDILLLMEDCLLTLGCGKGDDITFKITRGGTEVSAFCRECGWINMDKLLSLCCLYEFQCGHDVAVPYDAPATIMIWQTDMKSVFCGTPCRQRRLFAMNSNICHQNRFFA